MAFLPTFPIKNQPNVAKNYAIPMDGMGFYDFA